MGFVTVFISPNFNEDLVMCEDETGVLNKMVQQAVFRGTEANEFVIYPNAAAVKVNFQPVVNLNKGTCAGFDGFGAAEDGTDAADQFSRAEGFGDVVVCS